MGRLDAESREPAPLGCVEVDPAGEHDHRHAGRHRPPGHADHGLAGQALGVERALAGDHQIGVGEGLVEPDQVEQQVDARGQPGAEKREGPRADPAGCSGAGDPVDVDAEVAVQHLGEPGQPGVQGGDVVRAGALLRP